MIQRWGETPTWQYFSGNEYFEHQWPCDPTQLGRFRKALGEEGVEELLARTMKVAEHVKGNLIVGARSFPGNPYDGHTVYEQIEQSAILMQGLGLLLCLLQATGLAALVAKLAEIIGLNRLQTSYQRWVLA